MPVINYVLKTDRSWVKCNTKKDFIEIVCVCVDCTELFGLRIESRSLFPEYFSTEEALRQYFISQGTPDFRKVYRPKKL